MQPKTSTIVTLDQYPYHRYVWFQVWKWRSFSIYTWFLQWLQRFHAAHSGSTGGKSATSVMSERAPTTSRRQTVKLPTFCSSPIIRIFQWEHGLSHFCFVCTKKLCSSFKLLLNYSSQTINCQTNGKIHYFIHACNSLWQFLPYPPETCTCT